MSVDPAYDVWWELWTVALAEDGAGRDVTSLAAVDENARAEAALVAREQGTFAGRALLDILPQLCAANESDGSGTNEPRASARAALDCCATIENQNVPPRMPHGDLTVTSHVADGDALTPGMPIATLAGPLRLLLGIERTLLNFLERLCGVATQTRRFVDAVAGTRAAIYDTRKTIPGWRLLDKYAVRCGGGCNHRLGLHDAVLVKDNHLAAVPAGQWAAAARAMIQRLAALGLHPEFVEFEVDTLDQLDELLTVPGIDVILLDNFTPEQMAEAVRRRDQRALQGKVRLEASGGVTIEAVRRIAATGVERIAIGAITHSAPALDIGLDIPS
ncbi:MAG: carboxylating nicotinate-nucleotide diphosphorylase [Phycisphaerae bacterium]|nr:carboxylating nicotinate-nucleotide diphosphorylase [Phycisphaerae bacterium]